MTRDRLRFRLIEIASNYEQTNKQKIDFLKIKTENKQSSYWKIWCHLRWPINTQSKMSRNAMSKLSFSSDVRKIRMNNENK